MATEYNKHKFTESSTGLNLSEIKDGVDFPHTGLLKALLQTAKGNHVIKTGNGNADNDFAITRVNSSRITVRGGSYFRNNKLETISDSGNLDLGFTTANAYHLLVIDEAGAFAIRSPTAIDKVADTLLNDVIVAVLTYTGSSSDIKVQYLTNDKSANSLSLAHDNGGSQESTVYTQMGEILGHSTGITITASSALGNVGNILIENRDTDRYTEFAGNDGGSAGTTNKTIRFDWANLNAQFNDMNIITSGSVTAGGVTLTGGGVVTNHGADRLITSGASNTDLIGESNLTFNGSTNVLAVTGSMTSSVNITATNNITATLGSVSAGQNVSAPNVIAGTGQLSSSGMRNKSFQLVADATGGGYSTIHAFADFNTIMGNLTDNVLAPTKEVYYIGYDSQGVNNASHAGGAVINPTTAGSGTEFEKLVKATTVIQAGTVASHSYAAEDIFGGHALFFAINTPAANIGQSVTLHNITSFAMYIVVINKDEDPSQAILRNRVNGGFRAQDHYFDQEGNEKCIDMSEVMLRSIAYPDSTNDYTRDAILLKPRESITLQSVRITAAELGSVHDVDVYWQQGLYATQNDGQDISQWFITSSTGNNSNANIVRFDGANRHIPVHLTGTAFVCTGTNNILLPNRPPVGTQYSFLVKDGTTNINVPDFSTQANMFTSKGFAVGSNDGVYELSASSTTLPLAIAGGNAKTFIYTVQRNWEVIG